MALRRSAVSYHITVDIAIEFSLPSSPVAGELVFVL
jgi:hypothetical protein